jgi:hypothetical protein
VSSERGKGWPKKKAEGMRVDEHGKDFDDDTTRMRDKVD